MASLTTSLPPPNPPSNSPLPSDPPSNPPRIIRLPSEKPKSSPHPPAWARKNLRVSVDYDQGRRNVTGFVTGIQKDRIPAKYRLRVDGRKSQRDWTVTQVAERVLNVENPEEVDAVLNFWVGRYARRNFPLLIKEITNSGAIEHVLRNSPAT